jgi:hypothetical protein
MARLNTSERKAFYLKGLEEHRHLMRSAVDRMAEGDLVQAITIATSIRTLIHETGKCTPLLKRLHSDYLSLLIRSAKEPDEDRRYAHLQKKTVLKIAANFMISEGRFSLRPTIDTAGCELRTIGHWWTNAGLVVPGGVALSRKDIVLGIANKEGAHVDDDMPPAYRIMLESKSIRIKINDSEYEAMNMTRYVCGTAGVELLECLDRSFPPVGKN